MSRVRRTIIRLAAVVALAWAVAGVVIALSGRDRSDERCRAFRFDADAWKPETQTVVPRDRARIADRLVECDTLDGLSQRRVRRMLGRPRRLSRAEWTYRVRADQGLLRGGPRRLRITFDARRRVVGAVVEAATSS